MPPIETLDLPHYAVYWKFKSKNQLGEAICWPYEEIRVRWDRTKTNVLDSEGQKITVDATAIVREDIPIGSRIWLGKITDFVGTGSSDDYTQIMEVVSQDYTDDIKGQITHRDIGMKFAADGLPVIE